MRRAVAVAAAAVTTALAAAALGATPQPRLVSATVVGDRVNLTFSAALAQAPGGAVTLSVNGNAVRATRAVVSGRRLQLVLPSPVYGDDVVRVSGRSLRAKNRRLIQRFGLTAANRSTAGCTLDTEGPLDPATALGSRRYSILSVAVNFPDAPGDRPPLPLSGVDTWIRELSYGRAQVEWTEYPGAIRMPKNHADYVFSGDWGARKPFFQDLVIRLDPEIDFTRYDAVFVAHTSRRVPVPTQTVAVAPVGAGVVADGKELQHFGSFVTAEPGNGLAVLLRLAGLQKWNQEISGDWRGALDGLGQQHRSLLGWDRRKLGWLDPTQMRCLRDGPLEVTLTPLTLAGDVKLAVVPLTERALLVLENRQRVGLDATQCKSGILAYEVRPDTAYRVRVFAQETRLTQPPCSPLSLAPYDLRPGERATVAGVTFQAVALLEGGAYRLRVSRTA